MEIKIVNKQHFDKTMLFYNLTDSNVESMKDICFISINDSVGTSELPHFNMKHSNVLIQYFDDVEEEITVKNGITKVFDETQAKELIDFINNNVEKELCIIHCSAGISRSGAIGTFINDYVKNDYFKFKKDNPHIHPNQHVMRILNNYVRFNLLN